MKKRLILGIAGTLLAATCAVGITACGEGGGGEHVHQYDQEVISDEYKGGDASCYSRAYYYYSCKCGEMGGDYFYVGDYAHNFDLEIQNHKYLAKEADCSNKLSYYYSCDCGAVGTETFEVGDYGYHDFSDGDCSVCGMEKYSQELVYELSTDESYYIVVSFPWDSKDKEVVIPATHEGKPVKEIGDEAFYVGTMTSIKIPASVTKIGEGAFYYCRTLETVVFDGDSHLHTLGQKAFYNCESLIEIALPDTVESIGDQTFYCCKSLRSFIVPDSATTIGEYAFLACSNLTHLTIGSSVTSIGGDAFSSARLVEVVNKSPYLTIEKGTYDNGCVGLYAHAIYNSGDAYTGTKLSIEGDYQVYTDGDEKWLIRYHGTEETVTVPDTFTQIYREAFSYCEWIKSVTIPASIAKIGDAAFYYCENLAQVTFSGGALKEIGAGAFEYDNKLTHLIIPEGVISIGDWAFSNCEGLETVSLPNSLLCVGGNIFSGCDKLQGQKVGDCLYFGNSSNPYLFLYTVTNYDVESVSVQYGCQIIGESAIYNCFSLGSVYIPDTVISIGKDAFKYSAISDLRMDTTTWYVTQDYDVWCARTGGTIVDVTCDSLVNFYTEYYWYKL